MYENTIYTPGNLFEGINLESDSETEVLNEYVYAGVCFKELQFQGRVTGKEFLRPRGYGRLAKSCLEPSSPLLVIAGSADDAIDDNILAYFAKSGYNAFMFDYAGEDNSKKQFTIYPKEIDYANFLKADFHLNKAEPSARTTSLFEWTALAYMATTAAVSHTKSVKTGFLGIGRGADIAWILAAFDKRLDASCAVFAGGWDSYKGVSKFDGQSPEFTEERQKWLSGLAAETHAKFVKCPVLFITSSNSRRTDIERAHDTICRVPENQCTLFGISPRLSNIIGFLNTQNLNLFLSKFLKEQEIEIPDGAALSIEPAEKGALIKINAHCKEKIRDITVYYSKDNDAPSARNWYETPVSDFSGGSITAEIDCRPQSRLFVFANITYINGITVSTNVSSKTAAELKTPETNKIRNSLIYNSAMGKDCFTVFAHNKLKLMDIFLNEFALTLKPGPFNIGGCGAINNSLTTYKIGEPEFAGKEDDVFKFDIFSKEAQTLKINMLYHAGKTDERNMTAYFKLIGGNLWQPASLTRECFKTEDGYILKDWSGIGMLSFSADSDFQINNIMWL